MSSADSESISGLVKIAESSERVVIAILDATSPAACPPIPSATATRCDDARPLSSLPLRTRPTADRADVAK